MALHLHTFRTRSLTAVIFVVVMLLALYISKWSFISLFTIIHFGCWYEFVQLMKKIYGRKYLLYSLFGLIYITMPVLMIMHLRIQDSATMFGDWGWIMPAVLIFSLWINDTMAYIVGSFIGKTPLSPISPKKTWEGTIGGIILAVATITLVGYFVIGASNYISLIIISATAAIAGTLGDLLESKLKRMANVKDSGTIMPGHGGFLDRFDSLLVATPFVWLYINLIM